MSKTGIAVLFITSLFNTAAQAGVIFGTITEGKKAAANTAIEIRCGQQGPYKTSTNSQGSYSVRVGATGECSFRVTNKPGEPGAVVFSYAQPVRYDFTLIRGSNNIYTLN